MKPATPLAIALLCLPACRDADAAASEHAAVAAFGAFQDALFSGDVRAVRDLLTAESRPAADELPLAALHARQRLRVVGAEASGPRVRVHLRDPNDGDRETDYVVAREDGRFVVDLLATASLHARVTEGDGPPDFEPRELRPEDIDRIRRQQLEKPAH